MRLRVKEVQDGLESAIDRIGAKKYYRRYCMDVIGENNVVIGEVLGTAIRMKAVKQDVTLNDGSEFSAISGRVDGFYSVKDFLLEDELFLKGETRAYILEQIEFLEEYRTLGNRKKVLELTFEKMGAIIYAFDGEEWMNNLSEEEHERTWEEYDKLLLDNRWEYSDDFELFFKRRKTAFEAIMREIEEMDKFQAMLPDTLESLE
ncbi:hypothetical protein bcgnr5378_37990 [Bacillus cereus]|uniref:Uncharacterized protein n=1 Tax=Bacillus cereus TaxID=1396 RepID=A0A161R6N2_BACCE|nr:hypothetical protein [Bacillus cereus]KZD71871.1 hypothetical protein B4088_0332 [Bacillus cereus]